MIRKLHRYIYSISDTTFEVNQNMVIGTALMKKMLEHLKELNYPKASLAVQKENYAVRMYQKAGFEIVDENEQECIMIHRLGNNDNKKLH